MESVHSRILRDCRTYLTPDTDLCIALLYSDPAPGDSVHRGAQDRAGGRGREGQTTGD